MALVAALTLAATTEVKKDEVVAVIRICQTLVPALTPSCDNAPMAMIPNVQAATVVVVEATLATAGGLLFVILPLFVAHIPS